MHTYPPPSGSTTPSVNSDVSDNPSNPYYEPRSRNSTHSFRAHLAALSPLNPKRHSNLRYDFPDESKTPPDSAHLSAFYKRLSNFPQSDSEIFLAKNATSADNEKSQVLYQKYKRIHYIDGLRWLAAAVVVNGTLFNATLNNSDYPAIQRNSPLYVIRSSNLAISLLLLLSGRALLSAGNLWRVPIRSSEVSSMSQPTSDFPRLSRAMLLRPFRFILPVLVVAALQWGLAATGKTHNAATAGMEAPYWEQINSFAGFCTLIWNLFTVYESDPVAGRTFASNLFTVPWFFQGSYCAYMVHLMLGNLSSNRYWVYGLLAFFSWTTYNYFFLIIIGVFIADLSAHGHLDRIQESILPKRLIFRAVIVAIALVTQWVPVVRDKINYGLHVINVESHEEITFCDSIFVTALVLLVETSDWGQIIFGNAVVRRLGKLAPGMYLLAPALTFTLIPNIAVSMHDKGKSASTILGVSWITLFALCHLFGFVFYFFVELPSKLVAEWFGDAVLTGGVHRAGRRVQDDRRVSSPINVPA